MCNFLAGKDFFITKNICFRGANNYGATTTVKYFHSALQQARNFT